MGHRGLKLATNISRFTLVLWIFAELSTPGARAQQGPGGSSPDPLSALLNALKQGVPQSGQATGRSNPGLAQVGLKNIMPQYDDTKPLSQQYPHIAITVVRSPPNWRERRCNPTRLVAGSALFMDVGQ